MKPPRTWVAPNDGHGDVGIRVPFVKGKPCLDMSPWARPVTCCTRNEGHTGRHMAYTVTGRVIGVWE